MAEATVKLSDKLLSQLKVVKCPLLGCRTESWLRELIFSSSENHYKFLKWVIYSFDKNLEKNLDVDHYSSNSNSDKQLHSICLSLGLCGEDDIGIINGTAKEEVIMEFWELLLDLHLSHVRSLEENHSEEELLQNDLSGICVLDSSDMIDPLQNVESSPTELKSSLLPPDIEHEVRQFARTHNITTPTKEQVMEMLSSVQVKNCPEPEADTLEKPDEKDLHEQLMMSMKSLQETLPGFKKCHQQLQPWLKEKKTKQGTRHLEELVKTAAEKMEIFQNMLNDLEYATKDTSKTKLVTSDQKLLNNANVFAADNSKVITTLSEALYSSGKTD